MNEAVRLRVGIIILPSSEGAGVSLVSTGEGARRNYKLISKKLNIFANRAGPRPESDRPEAGFDRTGSGLDRTTAGNKLVPVPTLPPLSPPQGPEMVKKLP